MAELKEFFEAMETKVLLDPEGKKQAEWAENLEPMKTATKFRNEAIWVIFCSGISFRAARTMEQRYYETGECKHPHKAKAIKAWEKNYERWWDHYCEYSTDKGRLDFLRTLPYFGGEALVYQFCKNLGITDYCKPDVHLKRLAERWGAESAQELCESIAEWTGCTVAYIDTILWFSAMKRWAYDHM